MLSRWSHFASPAKRFELEYRLGRRWTRRTGRGDAAAELSEVFTKDARGAPRDERAPPKTC